jgi:hypothetical protein
VRILFYISVLALVFNISCSSVRGAYNVEIKVDKSKGEFPTRSMSVFVLLCDEKDGKKPPKFERGDDIDAWVTGPEGKKLRLTLQGLERAKRVVVKPDEQQLYKLTLKGGDKLGEEPVLFAVGHFTDTTKWNLQYKQINVLDRGRQKLYELILTPNTLRLKEEVEAQAEAAQPPPEE